MCTQQQRSAQKGRMFSAAVQPVAARSPSGSALSCCAAHCLQHGRSFVQAHQQPNTTIATARSLHSNNLSTTLNNRGGSANGAGSSSTLPSKSHTLSTSRSLNSTRIDVRNGHTQQQSLNATNQSSTLNASAAYANSGAPIPSGALHPNHITDVFPDALSTLTKTDEHTYSSAIHPAHGDHSHANYNSGAAAQQQHKVPMRMPIGPNLSQTQQQQQQQGNLFDQLNVTGMDDSVYASNGGGGGGGGAGPSSFLAAALSSDRVVPLQRENLRLVRSNNALQAHLVAEGERIDEAEKNWAQELRTIKTKYTDLQFLHAQKTRKIANQETKLSELQHRLEQVLSDRQAYVKESLEASSRLESGPVRAAATFRPQDPSALRSNSEVDLMKIHEAKLAEQNTLLNQHATRAAEWEVERTTLLAKISTRDTEVKRLSEVLESERNWDKIQAEASLKGQHKSLQKLQAQIDFLNEQRTTWERESNSFKEHGVSAHFVAQLQESRAETSRAREDAAQAHQRIQALQVQLEGVQQKLQKAESSRQGVDERVFEGVQQAEAVARAQIERLQQAQEALQAQLAQEEQGHLDAQSQITTLRHELHLLNQNASTKSSQLNSNATLMNHHETLIAKLNGQVSDLRSACRTLESQRAKIESEWRLSQQELAQSQSALESLRDQATARGLGLQDKGQEVVELREALEQAREEAHALNIQIKQRDQRIQALHAELQVAQGEKDNMLASITQADTTLATIQNEVQRLHEDRETREQDYANLYEDYTQQSAQLAEMRQATFPSLQGQLTSLRAEKAALQSALDDIQTNTVGDLSQREQSLKSEVVRLSTSHRELLDRLDQEQQTTLDLQARIASLEGDLQTLATASSSKTSQISSGQTLLQHHTDLISKLNIQITDLKSACRSVEAQRSKLEGEWSRSREDAASARRELQLQMDLHTSQSIVLQERLQEIADLRAQLSDTDMARHNIHQELLQNQQRLEQAALEREERGQAEMRWNSTLDESTAQTAALQDALRAREVELSQVSSQVSALMKSSSKLSEENALKSTDLKAVLADLENVLRENQMLTREVAGLRQSKEDTSLDAERQATRAKHAEELYRAKEGECLDLLSNYRSVCGELERLRITGGELDAERAASRQALKGAQEAQDALSGSLGAAQAELRKRMVDLQAAEQTAQQLSRALEQQKKTIDGLHAEKASMLAATQGAQAVAGGLEQSRVEGLRALSEQRSALASAQRDLESLGMDNRHLQGLLEQARNHAQKLEAIIADMRQQAALASGQASVATQDKNARIDKLQQELQQAKIAAEAMQDQIQSLNQYREKQNAEINRLLQTLASAPPAASSGSLSSPSKSSSAAAAAAAAAASAEYLSQLSSLQSVIDGQFARIQSLQTEKSKLKGYIVKYEAELRKWEKKAGGNSTNTSVAPSSTQPSPQPQQQQQQQQSHLLQHSLLVHNQTSASFHVQNA